MDLAGEILGAKEFCDGTSKILGAHKKGAPGMAAHGLGAARTLSWILANKLTDISKHSGNTFFCEFLFIMRRVVPNCGHCLDML